MSKTFYINRICGIQNRQIYQGNDNPPFIPGFDTWLDIKALNLNIGYPWISFNCSKDFANPPRPYTVISNDKIVPGYSITFKDSALSDSSINYKNHMKVSTNNPINMSPRGITIFFPKSALFTNMSAPAKIYIDGPRPTYDGHGNPPQIADYDIWINMSHLGEQNPWVAFNRANDLISSPPPDIDTKNYSGFAIKFKSSAISDYHQGMKNPVEVNVTNKNVTKNSDGFITITIPKKDYFYAGFPDNSNNQNNENSTPTPIRGTLSGPFPIQLTDKNGVPYIVNIHTWV